jgi:hypothetical protein
MNGHRKFDTDKWQRELKAKEEAKAKAKTSKPFKTLTAKEKDGLLESLSKLHELIES